MFIIYSCIYENSALSRNFIQKTGQKPDKTVRGKNDPAERLIREK